jgi:carbamoyltransferase
MITRIIRDQDEILELIIEKEQIVAMFQGVGEWGPRALGNRSILFDPRHKEAKQIVNSVKKRENYRPFAGSVMLEHAHDWFEMLQLKESPWMSFAIQAKEIAYEKVPTLVHADGTCRIQTVTEEQNKNYYNLIKGFYEITGVPMIFNTSFNLGGEALVETIEDAIDTCNRSEINYLYVPEDQDIYIPEHLIKFKVLEEVNVNDNAES